MSKTADIKKTFYALNESDGKQYRQKYNNYLHVHTCGANTYSNEPYIRKKGGVAYMINMVISGSLNDNSNNINPDDKTTVGPGSVIIYKPREPQYLTDMSPDLVRYWIHFTGFGVPELLQECELYDERFFTIRHTDRLEKLFLKIFNELHSTNKCKQINLNSYMLSLLSEISRAIDADDFSKEISNKERLTKAINMINTKYKENLSLEQLAQSCYMSKYYFIKLFKAYAGHTPYEYLANVRIENAKEMLCMTDMKISDIGAAVGISDQNHFTKFFKEHTGVTPTLYRHNESLPPSPRNFEQ